MYIFGVPAWFFLAVAVVSLFLGVGLRRYLDYRKVRAEQMHRDELKELKKQLKRSKKHAKKTKGKK